MPMLRQSLISTLVFAAMLPAALADESRLSAQVAPSLKTIPAPLPDLREKEQGCDPAVCGLVLPEDLWKRDAPGKTGNGYMNEDAIVRDRSRRNALDVRFQETPPVEIRLGKSNCFISPQFVDGIFRVLKCGF